MGSAVILKVVTILMWMCSAGTMVTSRRSERSSGDQNLPRSYLYLPGTLHFRNPLVPPEYFSPTRGTGFEPLPSPVRELLLPVAPTPDSPAAALEPRGVYTRCDGVKMGVQVWNSVLGSGGYPSNLSLGTCGPTGSTAEFIYFEIGFNQCRTVRTMINNQLVYSNILRYDPPASGLIRRAAPFTVQVSCQYDRYHYSYKIGYIPKMETQGVFKPMTSPEDFILTPRNARWERLSPWDHYVLGKPMFFEVEARSLAPDRRLYIQNCNATLGLSSTSTPRLAIVDNFGCMVKQVARSRFIRSGNNRVRFTVDAFLLEATGQPLYMHCSVSTADSTMTPTAKACNYDSASAQWTDVSGLESVCSCCENSCSSAPSSDTTLVRSRAWTVVRRGRPSAHPKRMMSMTAATTMTPTTVGMMTKSKTSQQEGTAVSPVDMDAPEWEWPVKVLRDSAVDGKVLKGSGGAKDILKASGVVKEVLRGSGVVKEVLKGSGGVGKVLKSSGAVKETLTTNSGAVEVVKAPETIREVLKGSEGVPNISSGVEDGKVTKGSEEVEVLEGSDVVGKQDKGLAVEPLRIFEHFFGLDK